MHALRPYQSDAVNHAIGFVLSAQPGDRQMYAAPTGTGKGTIQLAVQKALKALGKTCHIITPSIEIADGYAERMGVECPDQLDVHTRIRYRNMVAQGKIEPPDVLILDECHHEVDGNVVTDHLVGFMPGIIWLGYTATGYRATPKSTHKLWEDWGRPHQIIGMAEAIRQGYMTMPDIELEPLIDDDIIETQNGEFVIRQAESFLTPRLESIAHVCKREWDAPLMLSLPSTELVRIFVKEYQHIVPSRCILQDTPYHERKAVFDAVERKDCILVQINVVSEGVDLPWMRNLVDAKPTMSPVLWLQQFGRICRPGEEPAKYVCTNRNLERHAYLLEGMLPNTKMAQAQQMFEGTSSRTGNRAFGLEAVGKFKPLPFPMKGGIEGTLYYITRTVPEFEGGTTVEQWSVVVLPNHAEPMTARRTYKRSATGEVDWGKWELAPTPEDFAGFATAPRRYRKPTPRQLAWWKRSAGVFGLDSDSEPDARNFQILPILKDVNMRIL